MPAIVYLDVEDEITTAASRIRHADGARLAIFVPFGSRVATSRINFRLLAREAQDAGRRLDIVAPDASARALAASAGLAVFASVGEYEEALADGGPARAEPGHGAGQGSPRAGAVGPAAARRVGQPTVADPAPGTAPRPEGAGETPTGRRRQARPAPALGGPSGAAGTGHAPHAAAPARRAGRRGVLILLLAFAVVALGAGGLAAAVALPHATITVTPRMEPVPPVALTVRADTAATAVDPSVPSIPAVAVQVPLTASGEFAATGTSVVQTAATGQVTFDSVNTVSAMPIPRGTLVSTPDGVAFATAAAVTVPRATVSGSQITHGLASVRVVATAPGPRGNVAARAISQVPSSLAALQVSVSNAAATSGGARTETPKITAEDVAAARAKAAEDIAAQLPEAASDPTLAPDGTTLYPETASLGDVAYSPDPASLEGRVLKAGQTTFTLSASATASVTAVDEGPLRGLGDRAIRAAVPSGSQIAPDSIEVTVGGGTVSEDGTVSYVVRASALAHRPLDAAALVRSVLGKTEAAARSALAPYGRVEIALSPFWVSTVPSEPDRVTLVIGAPERPAATPTPGPTATPHRSPRPPSPSAAPGGSASSAAPPAAPSAPASAAPPAASPVPSG